MNSIKEQNPWNIKDVGIYILLVFCEVLIVWGLIALLSMFGVTAQVQQMLTSLPQGYAIFFLYLVQTLLFGLPLLFLMQQKRVEKKRESCLFVPTKWYNVLLVAPGTWIVTMIALGLLFTWFGANNLDVPGFTGEKTQIVNEFGVDLIGRILAFVTAVFIAPIIEELVFRGFMLRAFAKHLPVWGAVVASSVLFSAIHVTPGVFFPLMILGAVMAILTVKTKSIYPAIVFHMINNSMAFVAEVLVQYMPPEQVSGVIHSISKLWF